MLQIGFHGKQTLKWKLKQGVRSPAGRGKRRKQIGQRESQKILRCPYGEFWSWAGLQGGSCVGQGGWVLTSMLIRLWVGDALGKGHGLRPHSILQDLETKAFSPERDLPRQIPVLTTVEFSLSVDFGDCRSQKRDPTVFRSPFTILDELLVNHLVFYFYCKKISQKVRLNFPQFKKKSTK